MRRTAKVAFAGAAAVAVGAPALISWALSPVPAASGTATAMAGAAAKLLSALAPEQKTRAAYGWEDATRVDFHFVPMARAGLPLKMMTPPQRELAQALLKTGLSDAGYGKISRIIELEKVLAEVEKNPVKRDPEMYHFWVYGTPAPRGTWGWKFEGHHISLNFTVVKGATVVTTPLFMGANPAEVRVEGPQKGRRALRGEEDLARELVQSFDDKARAEAVFDVKALPEILSFDSSQAKALPPVGATARTMTAKQKELLRKLLAEYVAAMPAPLAAERLAKLERAGFDNLRFGWAGGVQRGLPHYYRVQGPTFLIEYDCTQTNANHIHTTWRDFDGDFGRDLLREHLKAAHQQPGPSR